MAGFPSFKQQVEAKSPWKLDEDARLGFAQSLYNNTPQMALYYAQEIFKEYDARIEALEHQLEPYLKAAAKEKTATVSRAKKDDSGE